MNGPADRIGTPSASWRGNRDVGLAPNTRKVTQPEATLYRQTGLESAPLPLAVLVEIHLHGRLCCSLTSPPVGSDRACNHLSASPRPNCGATSRLLLCYITNTSSPVVQLSSRCTYCPTPIHYRHSSAMSSFVGLPFFLEDQRGDITNSDFVDYYGRMSFSIRCTLQAGGHNAYAVTDALSGSRTALATLVFGPSHALGTVQYGQGAMVPMDQYLAKVGRKYVLTRVEQPCSSC